MKRVLFVISEFNIGGTNKSLQNILNLLEVDKYQADVYAIIANGPYKTEFNNCNIVKSSFLFQYLFAHLEKENGLKKGLSFIVKIVNKITFGLFYRLLNKKELCKIRKNSYDAIIAFSEGLPTTFVSKIKHSNKIAWVHCNYESYQKINGGIDEKHLYDGYKHIVNVSEFTKKSFIEIYNFLENKCVCIYNPLDVDMMKSLAKKTADVEFSKDCLNILSIGRIDPVKRFSNIPAIARRIKDSGANFHWYIIGPKGNQLDEYIRLQNNITQYNVENEVSLLGEQQNPYCYIDQSDLLVNTSISEACPYVINESKILGVPVVCTNFGSAREFVTDDINGYTVPIDNLAEKILYIIQHPEISEEFKSNLKSFVYDNNQIMKNIYDLI
ncbi:glycosyltransferase [Macellibacteroides fermentans]|uniref:glycosyltransferase n=1 Tax=Macellibacteroides fermentans TaxID=879969 RepID=UPI00406C8C1A